MKEAPPAQKGTTTHYGCVLRPTTVKEATVPGHGVYITQGSPEKQTCDIYELAYRIIKAEKFQDLPFASWRFRKVSGVI